MRKLVREITMIAGKSLQAEDKLLSKATSRYHKLAGEQECGLLRNGFNEHHYQYVIGRALMISFPYITMLERENRTDILIKYPKMDNGKAFAAIEIKTYFKGGASEDAGIKKDITKKLSKRVANPTRGVR